MSDLAEGLYCQGLLQGILDGVAIRVFWKDREGHYLGCNRLFARDAGYLSPEQLVGKTDFDLGWKKQAEHYRADDLAVMESGEAKLGYEEQRSTPGGNTMWARTSKVPLREDGKTVGVLGTYEDITAHKVIEEQLRNSEARFRTIVEQSSLPIQVVSLDGRISRVNAAWEQMWGVPFAALANYNLLQDRQLAELGILPLLQGALAGESVEIPEIRYDKAATPEVESEPGELWVRTHVYPVRDNAGLVHEIVLIQEDTSQRKLGERALKESEERLRLALDAAHQAWFDMSLPTGKAQVSPEYAALLGYEREEFDASLQHWMDSLHPDDKQAVLGAFQHCLETNGPEAMEYRRRTKQGDWKWMHTVGKIIEWDDDGNPLRIVGINTDITARKQAEQLIAESERSYRGIFNSLNEAVYILDENGMLLDVNEGAVRMYGYPHDFFIGKTALDLAAPGKTDLSQVPDLLRLVLSGETLSMEFWGLRANGEVFPKELHGYPGEYFGQRVVIVVAVDITERKRAEEEMAAGRKRFQTLFDSSADGYFVLDMQGRFIDVNKTACERLGYSKQEMLAMAVAELVPPAFADGVSERLARIGKEGAATFESAHIRKDGTVMPVEVNSRVMELDGQQVQFSMVRDITERKRQNELLEASRQRFLTLFDSSADALMIHDAEGRIHEVNRTICERLGYSRDEMLAMNVSDLVSPRFADQVSMRLDTISQQGRMMFESEHCAKDGRVIPVELSARGIELDGEQVVFSISRDISERKMFEEQLRQSQKMEAIGTLVGGIAHDFNNMLAAIQGNVYLASMQLRNNPIAREKLNNIEQLGKRAAEMVQQLLTFARKDTVEMRTFNLNDFTKEALKLAATVIPENIEHQVEICDEELNVRGDITQMQQVLMNLLNNAVDALADVAQPVIHSSLVPYKADAAFSRRHPELTGDDFACLTVSDNGHGISGELLDKIFEPFFTTKEVGKGTGLGLAMIYGAVQNHGGVIEVESELGKGTALHVYLPLTNDSDTGAVDTGLPASRQGEGETILLVDDEERLRSTTAEVLSLLGYQTIQAVDGAQALKLFGENRQRIALVISDVIMPSMGGVELIEQLRRVDADLPVILVTGYDKQHVLEGGGQFGQCEVVSKPFDFHELSRIIQSLIDVRRG